MRNVIGGFWVGFGLCWGFLVAGGRAAVLIKISERLTELVR